MLRHPEPDVLSSLAEVLDTGSAGLLLHVLRCEDCAGVQERATYCHLLAALRRDQEWSDEALALLVRAADLLGEAGNRTLRTIWSGCGRACAVSPKPDQFQEEKPMVLPQEVRDEVDRMREALRAAALRSRLSYGKIEEALSMSAGYLTVIFSGKAQLRVSHVFGILAVIGMSSWDFFAELAPAEGRPEGSAAGHHPA